MTDTAIMARRLGVDDVDSLRALMSVFAVAFEEPETYLAAPQTDAGVEALLARDTFVAVVAEAGSEVIGGLTAYVLPKPERAHSEIYIYDLAVSARYRRRGVATALIAELQAIAHEVGAWIVYIQAELDEPAPNALYGALGQGATIRHYELTPKPRR